MMALSLGKKAKPGLATLKCKATEALSPKPKKAHIPEDAEAQVCESEAASEDKEAELSELLLSTA